MIQSIYSPYAEPNEHVIYIWNDEVWSETIRLYYIPQEDKWHVTSEQTLMHVYGGKK